MSWLCCCVLSMKLYTKTQNRSELGSKVGKMQDILRCCLPLFLALRLLGAEAAGGGEQCDRVDWWLASLVSVSGAVMSAQWRLQNTSFKKGKSTNLNGTYL